MPFYRQLFPPVVPSSMPAYDGTKTVRFYFQMSMVNTRDQFKHAQVSVFKLDTNRNALNLDTYKAGIVFIYNEGIIYDSAKDMYYFDLPANLLSLDTYYKVQMRLGPQDLAAVSVPLDYNWLNTPAEAQQFSEWSTVCVIKPITPPSFGLVGFQSKDVNGNYVQPVYDPTGGNSKNVATNSGFYFSGSYSSPDVAQKEQISSYRMILFEDNGTTVESSWAILDDSGDKYIGEYEAQNIGHNFDHLLERLTYYYVKLSITTKNGYTESVIYKVYAMYILPSVNSAEVIVNANRDGAKLELTIRTYITDSNVTGIVVRRTSNRTNFKKWEDVVSFPIGAAQRNILYVARYDDVFVESGVAYKYTIQPASGVNRGPIAEPMIGILDYQYSWLIGEGEVQLKLPYNVQLNGFSIVVKETTVETIGSQYPFILKNSNVAYKQFQMSATISHHADENRIFMDKTDMFLQPGFANATNEMDETYYKFYQDRGMDQNSNYIFEREFRRRVTEFLYNGKPKVYKSDTEGLLFVKLTNISMTPRNDLGKTVYDFSCTVTEVGKVDFDSLVKSGIKKGV